MAALDDLPADQRAVLTLVLSRGRSYDEIATLLSIDRASVRDRAIAALDEVGPESDTSPLQRAVVTDYLLGQLPPGTATQTRDQLARSPADRAWASSVAQELMPLSAVPLAQIPEPVQIPDAAQPTDPAQIPEPTPRRSSRRGGAVLLAVIGLVLVGAVILIVALVTSTNKPGAPAGVLAGGAPAASSTQTTSTTPAASTTTPKLHFIAEVNLLSPDPTLAHKTAGIAQVVSDGNETGVVIVAQGMPANTRHDAYAVWLANAAGGSDFLGFVSKLVTSNGKLQTDGRLPANASRYSRLLITLETSAHPSSPGAIVLEGAFKLTG